MGIDVLEYNEGIIFKNLSDFELRHIFECGQCFRWNSIGDEEYVGIASERAVRVKKENNDVIIKGGKIQDRDFWINYFDLNRDYGKIKDELSKDPILKEAISYGGGIRILNQDPFEILISFIISANNRIPMIKKAVDNISKKFGKAIEFEDKIYYAFPNSEELHKASVKDLEECGCGFRAQYIFDTTDKIESEGINLFEIKNMNMEQAHKYLMEFKGIGPKVADCILLFSMEKSEAFPVDVWVKRVMQHFYLAPDVSLKKIRDFGMKEFGGYAGYAQQYLFFYARETKLRIDNE